MSTVFEDLRAAREQRNMTLSDIADATLINLQYLQAIDAGRVDALPGAYMRAFMREYAAHVGLDPAQVMAKFDGRPAEAAPAPPPPAVPAAAPPVPAATSVPAGPAHDGFDPSRYGRWAVSLVLVVLGGVMIWNLLSDGTTSTGEKPFQEVIRENEQHGAPAVAPAASATPAPTAGDSLTLTARTTDSVWVRMMIDETAPREYLFPPGRTMTWRGKERFLFFSIGNAGAMELTLNGKSLGPAGRRGQVAQRLAITAAGIVRPEPPRDSTP